MIKVVKGKSDKSPIQDDGEADAEEFAFDFDLTCVDSNRICISITFKNPFAISLDNSRDEILIQVRPTSLFKFVSVENQLIEVPLLIRKFGLPQ